MPMDDRYGFTVQENVPTAAARKRMEQEQQEQSELRDRIVMLEQENAHFRNQLQALEKEVRMLSMKMATL